MKWYKVGKKNRKQHVAIKNKQTDRFELQTKYNFKKWKIKLLKTSSMDALNRRLDMGTFKKRELVDRSEKLHRMQHWGTKT